MTSEKVVVNLAAGHEDADRVTVAFLVATAAQKSGREAVMFLTKEAVRLGLPGYADPIEIPGAPTVADLFAQFAAAGGELFVCPVCFEARGLNHEALLPSARIAGATPLFQWMGNTNATVFSY